MVGAVEGGHRHPLRAAHHAPVTFDQEEQQSEPTQADLQKRAPSGQAGEARTERLVVG